MTHVALYRKYRPEQFEDVLGQDHIVKVLSSAVKRGTISHAYLFAGSRGTGKTSLARIFAHAIGCTERDLYEIDAASNRGIDDIRGLREGVRTLPFESPYKVYIIDEVHMLTKEAFNALLKTLEEPPAHAVFILATTELGRLPETVVSRCQTFIFHKPTKAILRELLSNAAEKEGFSLEPAGAELMAVLSDGSFRDAYGILEKIAGSSRDRSVTADEILAVTGAPRNELVNAFISAIATGETAAGIAAISRASGEQVDMALFLRLALHKARSILLLRFSSDQEAALKQEFSDQDFDFIKKMSGTAGARISSSVLLSLLDAHTAMRHAAISELPLELVLFRLAERA